MTLKIDISGQKFGRLTALHDVGGNEQGRLWECLCECGKFTTVHAKRLKNGHTNSCGCLRSENGKKHAKKNLIAGSNKLPVEKANLNSVIAKYRHTAKERNLEFLLTGEQFQKLISSDCFYCGVEPCNIANGQRTNGKFIYNGIDRVDNKKGYVIGNCVTCCSICNRMKNAHTQQEFLTKIELIHNHILKVQNA